MGEANPKLLVARGYDVVAEKYMRWRAAQPRESVVGYLDRTTDGLPAGARVLDVGCGSGGPAQYLSEHFDVVGVDLSGRQLALAGEANPGANFLRCDMSALPFADATFDAAVALYSIIHVPKDEHRALVRRLHDLLRPRGRLFAVLGQQAWEGHESDWLVPGVDMFWSHHDREANLRLLDDAGFAVLEANIEPDPLGGAHLFVVVEKRA